MAVLVGCGGGGDGGTTQPAAVASVALAPSAPQAMVVTRTMQVTATPKDAAGAALSGRTITWGASPAAMVQLSSTSGASITVTALQPGATQLTATSEGKASSPLAVTIDPQQLTTLTVSPATATVAVGATTQLGVTAKDQLDGAIAGVAATFSSSNSAVASVNATSGVVTGVAAGGPVTITATVTAGGVTKSATSQITVGAASFPTTATVAAVGTTSWSPASVDIAVGGTVTFTNGTSAPHRVEYQGTPAGKPANSADFGNGQTVQSTFSTAGTFNYICGIHPNMTGTIIVH